MLGTPDFKQLSPTNQTARVSEWVLRDQTYRYTDLLTAGGSLALDSAKNIPMLPTVQYLIRCLTKVP